MQRQDKSAVGVVYHGLVTAGSRLTGGCPAWLSFLNSILDIKSVSAEQPLSMSYLKVGELRSSNDLVTCKDRRVVAEFLESVQVHSGLSRPTNASTSYCSQHTWAVQRCSSSSLAVCVDCTAPCSRTSLAALSTRILSPCETPLVPIVNEIRLFSMGFNRTKGPSLLEMDINPGLYDATVNLKLDKDAVVLCSLNSSEVTFPIARVLSIERVALVYLKALSPITKYSIACSAYTSDRYSLIETE
jgi:hypothetical protein